ncbi:hypothetical protein FS749_014550 [Ceratobasidium sp. UAMH 11750]|nr:hypothetical protein FS749_014550 [Ceratobasidium sp. UAMH 11750]
MSEKVVPSNSARRVLSPSVSPDPEEESETSKVEVLSNSDEELDEGSLEDESESDEESELGGSGRMRASRYLDCYAEEARSTKPNTQFQRAAVEGEDRWMGPKDGLLSFRKRLNTQEVLPQGKWTFSNKAISKQPLKDREVGDIHFSLRYAGGTEDFYWVCVDDPKRRWARCVEGQAHPRAPGYVLRARDGTKPPQWILAQSLQANKSRGRRSMD